MSKRVERIVRAIKPFVAELQEEAARIYSGEYGRTHYARGQVRIVLTDFGISLDERAAIMVALFPTLTKNDAPT